MHIPLQRLPSLSTLEHRRHHIIGVFPYLQARRLQPGHAKDGVGKGKGQGVVSPRVRGGTAAMAPIFLILGIRLFLAVAP